jgi:hypothetical protein
MASRLLRAAMLLLALAAIGVTALAWRLREGPVAIPAVTAMVRDILEAETTALAPGSRLELGEVSLAWAGWHAGEPVPVALRLDGLRLLDAAGVQRAAIPSVEVSVSVPRLLLGQIAPTRVVVRDPTAMLRRARDGTVTLDLAALPTGGLPNAPPPTGGGAPGAGETGTSETGADPTAGATDRPGAAQTPAPAGQSGEELSLEDLLRPQPPDSPLVALREVSVVGGRVRIWDEGLGVAAALADVAATVRRAARGDLEGEGAAALVLGDRRFPVRISARTGGEPLVAEGTLDLPSIPPADLARVLPVLSPLAALDAPVAARISARLALADQQLSARASLRAEAGAVIAAGRRTPFDAVSLDLSTNGTTFRLESAEFRPRAARPGVPAPHITATGSAARYGEAWRARVEARLDAVPVADLGAYWPEGVADGARRWIVDNLTAGVARDGAWWAELELPGDSAAPRLLGAGGTVRAEGGTVHWLRPIPPAEGVDAIIAFSPQEVSIAVRSGRQSGTALRVPEGRVRITDLGGSERLALEVRLTGPLADALEVIKHPRLRLFERKPLDLREPSGTLDGSLSVGLPLVADLPVDAIQLSANARLTNGRVAAIVAGQPLERANLDLSVDLAGLRMSGTANVGPVPSRVQAELDFRAGPPTQVTERVRAEGRADATAFNAFGVDPEDWVTGPVAVVAQVERRRNGETRVGLRGDLRDATLDLGPLAYVKRPGVAGTAEGVLRLQGDSLRVLEGVRVDAPDLLFRGALTFGARERVARVDIAEGRIGPTRATGNIVLPPERGGPWRIALRGPVADLRAMLDRPALDRQGGRGSAPAANEARGPPLLLDLRFDRVVLGEARVAAPVSATVGFDGRGSLRELRASGRSGGGPFDLAIAPRGAGRAVELASNDGGAVLRGMGLFDDMEGGRLRLAGAWAGEPFASPLTAVVEVEEFGIRNAPGAGKLLQALTIYGIPEAARGPGLAFSRLYAPFVLTEDTLSFSDAQAFSASLGITARGRILRRSDTLEVQGTVVPAYVFNSLLGRLPIIGRLFSAEAGGGLFAATFRATGALSDPSVSINPLAALTPGVLRGLFSALERPDPPAPP